MSDKPSFVTEKEAFIFEKLVYSVNELVEYFENMSKILFDQEIDNDRKESVSLGIFSILMPYYFETKKYNENKEEFMEYLTALIPRINDEYHTNFEMEFSVKSTDIEETPEDDPFIDKEV